MAVASRVGKWHGCYRLPVGLLLGPAPANTSKFKLCTKLKMTRKLRRSGCDSDAASADRFQAPFGVLLHTRNHSGRSQAQDSSSSSSERSHSKRRNLKT